MRIGITFFTTDEFISGVQYYTLGLINGLLQIDGSNDYFVFTNQSDVAKRYLRGQKNLHIISMDGLDWRVKRIFWEHFLANRELKRNGIDVLCCTAYICPVFDIGIPVVLIVHDCIAIDHREFCTAANAVYYNMFMPMSVRRAERVVAVSQFTAECIRRDFGVGDDKVEVVRPGVDDIFRQRFDKWELKQAVLKYELPGRYILYVGNIEPKKNIGMLLEVYKRLREKGVEHKLVIVGHRSWKSDDVWRKMQDDFGEGDIVIAGYVDREMLGCIYQMADVFLSVSRCEGFGFCGLEAMACGCAVAASRKGILKEMDEGCFYCLDEMDVEQCVEGVYEVINDKGLRQKLISAGRREVERFRWDGCARRMLEIYEEVVEE